MVKCRHPAALSAAQPGAHTRLTGFGESLNADMLGGTRTTPRQTGPVEARAGAIPLHLFRRRIHHRGQAQAHVQPSHAVVAPPQLDEFFLEFERHPTATPYLEG